MSSVDPLGINWNQLFVEAVKHRITPANPADKNTICINRNTFDQMVAVVEIASKARHAIPHDCDLVITAHNGEVDAKLRSETVGPVSATAMDILQALVALRRNYDQAVNSLLD